MKGLLAIAILGSLAFLGLIHLKPKPVRVTPAPTITQAVVAGVHTKSKPGLPVRLTIPAISVNAVIEQVGLTPESDMDIPNSPDIAGWYKLGPRPGEVGSSVIDGHFGYKNRIPAIFDNLHKLRDGDSIHIEDENGVKFTFIVRGSRTYGPDDDAAGIFQSSDGRAHLNLITCQGTWNKAQQAYSQRLVVFADIETE